MLYGKKGASPVLMEGAEPFFLPGGEEGVLLLHGFTGSPSEMKLYGRYLNERGYTVLAVRLPGHGVSAADMERVTAEDWFNGALDGYEILRGACAKVAVSGLSMGGLLALWLGTVRPVSRTVSLAAPVFVREGRDLHKLPPREAAKGRFLPKLHKVLPGIPPDCRVGYRVMPLLAVHELLDVIDRVKLALPRLRTPLLLVQSERDHTVEPESAPYIFRHVGAADKTLLWLKQSGHRLTIDSERETVFQKTAEFLRAGSEK